MHSITAFEGMLVAAGSTSTRIDVAPPRDPELHGDPSGDPGGARELLLVAGAPDHDARLDHAVDLEVELVVLRPRRCDRDIDDRPRRRRRRGLCFPVGRGAGAGSGLSNPASLARTDAGELPAIRLGAHVDDLLEHLAVLGREDAGLAGLGLGRVGLGRVGLGRVGLGRVGLAASGLAASGLAALGLAASGLAALGFSASDTGSTRIGLSSMLDPIRPLLPASTTRFSAASTHGSAALLAPEITSAS